MGVGRKGKERYHTYLRVGTLGKLKYVRMIVGVMTKLGPIEARGRVRYDTRKSGELAEARLKAQSNVRLPSWIYQRLYSS